MSLPKTLLPSFNLILPSDGTIVKFRPFIMKEEKLLLMALEDGKSITMLRAVHDIVVACTDGVINSNKCPLFDVQYAFLQIRAKSVSEISDFVVKCGQCQKNTPTEIDLTKINVERVEGHSKKIFLTENTGVIMRYPTIHHLDVLANYKDVSEIYTIIADCIETVFTAEEVYDATKETQEERLLFIDNLPVSHFAKIQHFFQTMPVLRYEHKFPCKHCNTENILPFEGIESFFV